jgi:hypothetical protein
LPEISVKIERIAQKLCEQSLGRARTVKQGIEASIKQNK